MSPFLQTEIELLVYWITERDRIRALKESGSPKPWTTDPLLRDYRWCNVRRMDDLVSRQLFDQWYPLVIGKRDALVAATTARYINWLPTLMEISDGNRFAPWCAVGFGNVLQWRAERGDKVFTGAYMIPGVPGKKKAESIPAIVRAVQNGNVWRSSQRETWEQLIKIDGLGSFLAGQIVADVAFMNVGGEWADREFWAPVGPGSARGMNRLLGIPKDKAMRQGAFMNFLPQLMTELRPLIKDVWQDRQLVAMDIQNCLCEFDKYRRLTLGEGKVRAGYAGR